MSIQDPLYGHLLVGSGVVIKGHCQVTETALVDGVIEGELHTKLLEVSNDGTINGVIIADIATINGHVGNDLTTHTSLSIKSQGIVTGKIKCTEIEIEQGGAVDGTINF